MAALVGGRWLALETAERAWAAGFAGGADLTAIRTWGRLLQLAVVTVTVAWTTANVLAVYRVIGSVQLPRRLGDIEILEAVPHRVLLGIAVGGGVVAGMLLSLGTGDWWHAALLAAAPPVWGETDPILGRDLGYYVAVLPWRSTLQGHAAWTTGATAALVAALYAAIGSLRFERRRVHASDHARIHLAVVLACFAAALAWGALVDPAEVVAGMHGDADQALLGVRLPAAPFVVVAAVTTAIVSLAWAWRDRPGLVVGSWAVVGGMLAGCYVLGPEIARAAGATDGPTLVRERTRLERRAFGLAALDDRAPAAFPSADAAIARLPLWDADRVALAAEVPPTHVAPWDARSWLVAPAGERGGAARLAVERDTSLAFTALPGVAQADTVRRFGPGVAAHAVVAAESLSVGERGPAIALAGAWRRAALAWTLQEPALTRGPERQVLLWRRDAGERLARLAPFAVFDPPEPAVWDGALWWVSCGYVAAASFPLARALPWRGGRTRYLAAGFVGAVRAANGETAIWLAPGHDSLAAFWARRLPRLVRLAPRGANTPPARFAYPRALFRAAAAQLAREGHGERVRTLRPADPFTLTLSGGARWTGVALEEGPRRRFAGLLLGTGTAGGPHLSLWSPGVPERLPASVVGSLDVAPGEPRIWPTGGGGTVLTLQARFSRAAPPRMAGVFVSLGERVGEGPTAGAALRQLARGGPPEGGAPPGDTSLAARWLELRRLVARADSALAAGDLERFGRIWSQIGRALAPARAPR